MLSASLLQLIGNSRLILNFNLLLLSGTLFIILLLISMHYEKERLLKFNVLYYMRTIELPKYLFL